MSAAADPDDLAIRAKPRPVRRFNRNALLIAASGAGLFIALTAVYALRAPDGDEGAARQELYNTASRSMPEAFEGLPASYADLSEPSQLGAPLPGDLGDAMLNPSSLSEPRDNPIRYAPENLPASSGGATHSGLPNPAEEARTSQLFFVAPQNRARESRLPSNSPANPGNANIFDQLAAYAPQDDRAAPTAFERGQADPGRQTRKEKFLSAEVDTAIYNPHALQSPVSPYQVMAGAIIPVSLVTGLNSDLPGQVIAQVTENVYDTPTGQFLLIPQGARLIGRYDSVIAFGQSRALMVWTRIIMPNGTSLTIENPPGVDLAGYAGVEDRVNNHTWRLFRAAILSSILSVGAELGRDSNDDELLDALRDGGQRTINQAGQEIVNRQLNVQPTITVRPGRRLRVIVNKDLVLKPYGG